MAELRMDKSESIAFMLAFGLAFFSGCTTIQTTSDAKSTPAPFTVIAKHSKTPVLVDGYLDDDVWQKTPSYSFSISRGYSLPLEKRIDKRPNIGKLAEPGEIKIAWDEKFLYVGAKLYDSDVVQENEENQKHHYLSGDVIEIFIKPEKNTWYWEIYGTPNDKKTVFWYPGRGRAGLQSGFEPTMDLDSVVIKTQIKGTLNNWKDKDEYWTMEIAIPVKELTRLGDAFDNNSRWRILIGRYNYSRYIPWKELSMVPQLSRTNFHLLEEFGILRFEK
ncbi:MAG: carbohydrate-binding family 9-like protein [Candidatus Omnitrophica bacterium]|nr:carbohydrate-binding family 9-like protein [Candidatus Omnitrophota bacterium]